ncbi:hypothetical protein IFM89_027974 [Coptis chinensis]|uniref:NAC domain-containing protein n=1 Tax=Coptis chinensis TaxID=261450 RepID=A0A835IDL2_9MAGN|nr:hypothetical protein IFM89_027974 [Coptis chinensis]
MTTPVIKYPPGFRFLPTGLQLIVPYLTNKLRDPHFKCPMINDANVYACHPQELVEKHKLNEEDTWYFFSQRVRKYKEGDRPDREAGNGYWKASGSKKDLIDQDKRKVGHTRALVYYEGKKVKNNPGKKTNWIMHEFWIQGYQIPKNKQSNCMKLDDWVLYKIHYNNTRGKSKRQEGSDNEDDVVQGQAKGEAKGKGKKYIGRNGKRRRQEGNDNEDDVDKGQAEVEGSRNNNLENLEVDSEFAASLEKAIELFDENYIPVSSMEDVPLPLVCNNFWSPEDYAHDDNQQVQVPVGNILNSLETGSGSGVDYKSQEMFANIGTSQENGRGNGFNCHNAEVYDNQFLNIQTSQANSVKCHRTGVNDDQQFVHTQAYGGGNNVNCQSAVVYQANDGGNSVNCQGAEVYGNKFHSVYTSQAYSDYSGASSLSIQSYNDRSGWQCL